MATKFLQEIPFEDIDISSVLEGKGIGNLMGITYNVTHEKSPIFKMKSPMTFTMGDEVIQIDSKAYTYKLSDITSDIDFANIDYGINIQCSG